MRDESDTRTRNRSNNALAIPIIAYGESGGVQCVPKGLGIDSNAVPDLPQELVLRHHSVPID